MRESDSVVFKDMLLTQGEYVIDVDCSSATDKNDFVFFADECELPFEYTSTTSEGNELIRFNLKVETDYIRLTLRAAQHLEKNMVFLGVKREETKNSYRAYFFDYHYSLKDHIRQIDNVLRFVEGNDELSILFKTLRYEMSANMADLRAKIDSISNLKKDTGN